VSSRLYSLAVKAANEAIKYDSEGKNDQAVYQYLQAFDLLMSIIRYTENKRLRDFYTGRAEQYLSRAYELKSAGRKPAVPLAREELKEDQEIQSRILSTILPEKPNVSWKDIADLQTAKQAIEDAIILPMQQPDLFRGVAWKGILLFGPPGCGKTLLAKAAANECNSTFFSVSTADILVKWLGESEQRIKALFEIARKNQPSIIFLDEIDALGVERTGTEDVHATRLLSQILQMMDGVLKKPDESLTVVLAATNRPWNLDSAMLRRFEKRILVPLPDPVARKEVLEITIRNIPNFKLADDVDKAELAKLTEGYSGDDLKSLCRDAWYIPIHELKQQNMLKTGSPRPVTRKDFLEALQMRKTSVSPDEIRLNEEWSQKFGTK
jgi:vacuolar protein-sorting-associated protein 4